jgi:hypothetical protein
MSGPIRELPLLPPDIPMDAAPWLIGALVDAAGRTWLHVRIPEVVRLYALPDFHMGLLVSMCDLSGWSTAGRWIAVGDQTTHHATPWFHPCSSKGQYLCEIGNPTTSFQLAGCGPRASQLLPIICEEARQCLGKSLDLVRVKP